MHIEANTLFTYPDLSIVCGELARWDNRNDTITNPVVLIEVLSKKTQNYDCGQKFKLCRSLPSLKEYILISSLETLVEQYTKQAIGFWNFRETANAEAIFHMEALGFSCPVKELYRNVIFEYKPFTNGYAAWPHNSLRNQISILPPATHFDSQTGTVRAGFRERNVRLNPCLCTPIHPAGHVRAGVLLC